MSRALPASLFVLAATCLGASGAAAQPSISQIGTSAAPTAYRWVVNETRADVDVFGTGFVEGVKMHFVGSVGGDTLEPLTTLRLSDKHVRLIGLRATIPAGAAPGDGRYYDLVITTPDGARTAFRRSLYRQLPTAAELQFVLDDDGDMAWLLEEQKKAEAEAMAGPMMLYGATGGALLAILLLIPLM